MKNHIDQAELFEISGCKQKSTLLNWLHVNQIQYKFTRQGRVWTTKYQLENSFDSDTGEVIKFGT